MIHLRPGVSKELKTKIMTKKFIHGYRGYKGFIMAMVIAFVALFNAERAEAAMTAEQVAQKAAAVISNAKGISATFTIKVDGRGMKGVLKSNGSMFSVILPQVSTWYNGKSLYTYNPRTSETTVITPTAQELLESNPLLYVKGGAGGYSYSFSPVKRNGKYVVELVPRSKKSGVKKLTFTISATDFRTERIAVETASGLTTVDITSFKSGVSIPVSEFEYPKARYPKAEIIDLR